MNRKQNIIIALLVVIIVILISPALIFAAVYNSSMKQMALHPIPTARRPQTAEEVTEAIDLACKKSFGSDYELIPDYEKIEALVRTTGAAFCLSGAGPTLLCITRHKDLQEKLAKKLHTITEKNWQMIPLHVEFQGAHILTQE